MHSTTNRWSGSALTDILNVIVVLGFFTLAAFNFKTHRETHQLSRVVVNLRIIEGAKDQWAISNKKNVGVTPEPKDLAPYLRNGSFPPAVVGETYRVNPVGTPATATTRVKLRKYRPGNTITIPPAQ